MNTEITSTRIDLRMHRYGRIDKRMQVGPVQWPFHDLLWIHEGQIALNFPQLDTGVTLAAPAGVLILPNTQFAGQTIGSFASVSVCHFEYGPDGAPGFMAPGYCMPLDGERIHCQNLVRLAMFLARRNEKRDLGRRRRLLCTILDGFDISGQQKTAPAPGAHDRLAAAWELAAENLADMRTLSDVAALIGINESGFRTLHRSASRTSAGEHLRKLRLGRAEELLATTGFTLWEISRKIGYRHAESFSAAFKKSRGMTPGAYRRWSKPFA